MIPAAFATSKATELAATLFDTKPTFVCAAMDGGGSALCVDNRLTHAAFCCRLAHLRLVKSAWLCYNPPVYRTYVLIPRQRSRAEVGEPHLTMARYYGEQSNQLTTVAVKITDMLGEEVLVVKQV
jgi:hypothetical protein